MFNPERAWRLKNSDDLYFAVDDDTSKVTIEMRDVTGDRDTYGHGYRYWFHPDHFDVLVNDVVEEDHHYVFYPVSLDLVFITPRPVDATVKIRGHILNQQDLMWGVASQWLLKIGMVVDVKGAEFERVQRRFTMVMNKLYGPRLHRRSR